MIANGIDLATVSKRLGHADTSITARIYTHAIKEADAVAADALENLFLRDKKAWNLLCNGQIMDKIKK